MSLPLELTFKNSYLLGPNPGQRATGPPRSVSHQALAGQVAGVSLMKRSELWAHLESLPQHLLSRLNEELLSIPPSPDWPRPPVSGSRPGGPAQ